MHLQEEEERKQQEELKKKQEKEKAKKAEESNDLFDAHNFDIKIDLGAPPPGKSYICVNIFIYSAF